MATLSSLVIALAWISALPESKVFAYGRFAREAGLITQEGRGKYAANMSPRDAANLLIATCGTDVTREAPRAIRAFRPMKGTLMAFEDDIHLAFEQWLSPIGLRRESDGLHLQVDFGAFLEFLIWEAGTGRLVQLLIKLFGVSSREKLQSYDFSVYEYEFGVFEPVEVEVSFDRTEPGAVVAFTSNSEPLGLVHFSPAKFKTRRDLHVRAQVSHYTLMVLALFLKGRLVPGDLTSEKDLYRILRRRETWERAPAITSQRKGVQGE